MSIAFMTIMMGFCLTSCGDDPKVDRHSGTTDEIIQNLMSHKWTGQATEYNTYSSGAYTFTQTWTVYFMSEHEGIIHCVIVDKDSSLGTKKREEHSEFTYSVDGTKVRLSGGCNFVFDYFGDFMMEGETIYTPSNMASSDYSYLNDHEQGYHGTDGEIDTELFVIDDKDILYGAVDLDNGWYGYMLLLGFGAVDDDAYKKGITEMRLTAWADNGTLDKTFKTANYGKKKTYTLYLSSTTREWADFISVQSKDRKITFNYEIEYYNSKDGDWYPAFSKKLTFSVPD